MKILVSTSSFGKADPTPLEELRKKCEVVLNPYGRKLTTDEFVDLTEGMDGVIAGVEPITREALEKRGNIKVISRCGVGLDSVDIEACKDLGIAIFNTPQAPVGSVAELTVTLMLDLIKNVSNMNAAVKAGSWNKMTGLMLEGKKVGIIGFGRIGQRVAGILQSFGVEIAYTDIEKKENAYRFMEKDELIKWADIITIHSSFCEEGKYIIGSKELADMKGCYLVNTSRGRFVEEDALFDSLTNGGLAGAALDVFGTEPYKGKLSTLDNVILTPHVASSAKEGRAVMEMEAVQNLFTGLGIAND